jgi:cyanate lyase
MEALLILAALAIILMFWVVKRYLIRRKAFKNRTAKPGLRKTESAPAAAENRSGDSGTVRPVIDRRQAGIADRRQHAVQEQTAAPASVAVREETPAALKEEAKIAEAPMQKPEPVAVKEEAPVAVEKAKAPTPEPAPSVGREELPADWLPEDSVLRRHYLTQMQAEREALTNPYPTDSTLRRHYDAMVKIQVDGPSLQDREEEMPTREESRRQNAASGQAAIHSLENEIASERESSSAATYDELQAEAETVNEAWLPEDSVLRRHYLTQLQTDREALTNPYPTDSTLRRHYDAMVKIQVDGPSLQAREAEMPTREESRRQNAASGQAAIHSLENEIASERESSSAATYDEIQAEAETVNEAWLPEDSVLRRHYLTQLQTDREALTNPYPTDSMLRRHYETMIRMQLDWPSAQESREQAPVPQERAVEVAASEPSVVQSSQPEAKAEPAMRNEAFVRVESKTGIPEDSILRRHFLSNLQTQIESELPDSPTDSVLKRHHDTLVCTKLAERLERMQG